MIDTAKPKYYMTDLVFDRLQDVTAQERLGLKIYHNKFYLLHPFGHDNPKVFFNTEKRSLSFETSLPKLFQGHNVFGTNRLQFLCIEAIKLVYQQLGLRFSSEQRGEILARRIRLNRLDTTCSFYLGSPLFVANVAEAVWQQLRAEGFSWSAYGIHDFESVYNQQNSTRVTDKFYDKLRELMALKRPYDAREWALIYRFVIGLLRFEVTWRAKELKDLKLEYADQWSPALVKEMITKRLTQFRFQGVIKERVEAPYLDDLNDSCHMYYSLWNEGANLRKHRYNRPLSRAREQILKQHQVDIYRTPRSGSDISLSALLNPEIAYFSAPKSLVTRGVIFGMGNGR